VLSTHQGGVPLRPVPLDVARCLRVLGAELPPLPPPVRRWHGRVVAADIPWTSGEAFHSCDSRHLVSASCCRRCRLGVSAGTTLSLSSRPGLGASAWLATFAAPCPGGGLLLLLITLAGLPLLPSEM
jgi:hypothetical protein